jgi:hypothetical protein
MPRAKTEDFVKITIRVRKDQKELLDKTKDYRGQDVIVRDALDLYFSGKQPPPPQEKPKIRETKEKPKVDDKMIGKLLERF